MWLVMMMLACSRPRDVVETDDSTSVIDDTAWGDTDVDTDSDSDSDTDSDSDSDTDTDTYTGGVTFGCVGPWPTPYTMYLGLIVNGWVEMEEIDCPSSDIDFFWVKMAPSPAKEAEVTEVDPRVVSMPWQGSHGDIFTLVIGSDQYVTTECSVTYTTDEGTETWPIRFQALPEP